MVEKALDKLDVILSPATAGQYLRSKVLMSFTSLKFFHTVCLGFFEMGSILARTWPGRLRPFEYFRSFQIGTWSLLLTSIVILSVMSAIKLKNLRFVYECAWNYFNLLFQKSFQRFNLKKNQNYFLYIWVLSSLFLSILFCADLLDNMVRAQPTVKIDSLEQLVKSNLKIIARVDSALAEFAELKEIKLANQIKPLLEIYYNVNSEDYLAKCLRAGTHAYINQKLVLMFAAKAMSFLEGIGLNLIEILHISEDDGGLEPYFIFVNQVTDKKVLLNLNYV